MLSLLTTLAILTLSDAIKLPVGGNRPLCGICMAIIGDLDKALEHPWEQEIIDKVALVECEAIEATGQCEGVEECKDMCTGIVREYGEMVSHLWIEKYLGPRFICGQLKKCDPPPFPGPPPLPFKQVLGDSGDRSTNKGIGRIVQIGDVHWDPWYRTGAPSLCQEALCCRLDDNDLGNNTQPAEPWGNLNDCDAPTSVVSSLFDEVGKLHKQTPFDFAICAGDGPPHDIWNQSEARHIQIMKDLKGFIAKALPDIPMYFTVGNHEGYPVDNFRNPPDDFWMYKNMSALYGPDVDRKVPGMTDSPPASTVMGFAGFYTTLFAPGLRIVHVNCGYFDGGNFFLKYTNESQDMGRQLEWLSSVFGQARALKEDVFLLQHFPIGYFDGVLRDRYYDLYIEYRDIIKVVFSGHTHVDKFHVWGAMNEATGFKPFAVNYSPGSVTQKDNRFPQFRVYTYDRATNELLDYEHYHMDVFKSNKLNQAVWERGYSARATYGLPDLRPESWKQMVLSMNANPELYRTYQSLTMGGGPVKITQTINTTICDLLSAGPDDLATCKKTHPGVISVEEWLELKDWRNNP